MNYCINSNWLRWWNTEFVFTIDDSWNELSWFTFSQEQRDYILNKIPRYSLHLLNVQSYQLENPNAITINLVNINGFKLGSFLTLLSEICIPGRNNLLVEERSWCLKISKATGSQSWFPRELIDLKKENFLFLLIFILGRGTWERLRMHFNKSLVIECEHIAQSQSDLPVKKIKTIFESIFLRLNAGE